MYLSHFVITKILPKILKNHSHQTSLLCDWKPARNANVDKINIVPQSRCLFIGKYEHVKQFKKKFKNDLIESIFYLRFSNVYSDQGFYNSGKKLP